MLRQNGVAVELYAGHFDLALNDIVHTARSDCARCRRPTMCCIFFLDFRPAFEGRSGAPAARKIAYFHASRRPNCCRCSIRMSGGLPQGLAQLPELARFDVLAANSAATRRNLFAPSSEVSGASRT